MSSTTTSVDRLSLEEVDATFRAMSPADWARALSLARLGAAGLIGWTEQTLLAEALVKLQSGERVWRRGVPPLVTLKVAMRSIASNEWKKAKAAPIDRFAVVDVGAGADPDAHAENGDTSEGVSALDDRSPDQIVDSRSQLAAIETLVADDEDAAMVLMAWSEGLRGQEAAAELGFDMKRYNAARKRLERKLKPIANLRNTK